MMGLKKFFSTLAVVLAVGFSNFFIAESSPNESAATTKKDFKTLKVGYVVNTGFMEKDRLDHNVGYGYEYMKFLENYMPYNFEYVMFDDWTDLLDKLNSGEIDIVPNLPGDHKWLVNATSTEHVVGRFPMELVIRPDQIKPNIKLARVRTNYDTPGLDKVAETEGFKYTLVNYKTYQDILNAYNKGEVDGYVDAMLFYNKQKPTYAVFDRQNYRLSVRADRTDLLESLNLAMDNLLMYQTNIRDILKRKYYLREGFPLLLNREEKKFLEEKKKLRTAVLLYQKPRIHRDNEGNLVGIMPDLIKKISEDLNIEIEIVETSSYKEARNLMAEGKVDFIADAICDFSWAEKYNINPTQPYFKIDYVPVTRENYSLNSSANPKVACVSNMLFTMSFIEPKFPEKNIIYFQTFEECLKAVNSGHADVVYVNRDAVHSLIEDAETYDLEIGTMSVYSQFISLGTCLNGDLRLWHILNKEVSHLDISWINDTLSKYQRTETKFSLKKWISHNPLNAFLIVVLLLSGIGVYLYRRNMNKKNFELIQHMAYTDSRYNLPNVAWLEMKIPSEVEKLKKENPDTKTFLVVFSMLSSAIMTESMGYKLLDKHFHALADGLKNSDSVIFISAGIGMGNLICFCKADNAEELSTWAMEVIKKYNYMDTADASTKIVIHMKAGISFYDESLDIRQIISHSMVACQQVSGNEVKIFDEKMKENFISEYNIENRMFDALKNEEFKPFYQPKYDIETKKIIGAEALVRWISPVTGFMSPGKFIPLFEQNGFIIQVDYYILEKTCQLIMERIESGKEVLPISVNQSRLHMTEDGYLEKMRAIVEKYKLPAGMVELEITETMFGDFDKKTARQNAEKIINSLKEMGFIISVDDFGAGYSSFSLLSSLPMDVMKIDRSVLTGADSSTRMKKILENVIELGRSLGMNVICEGIETVEEEKLLLSLGCRYGQGFLNAKPMPVDEFINFFEKRNLEVRGR